MSMFEYISSNILAFSITIYVSLADGSCYAKLFHLPLEPRQGLLVRTSEGPLILDNVWCNDKGAIWAFVEEDEDETDHIERRKEELISLGFITELEYDASEKAERRNIPPL